MIREKSPKLSQFIQQFTENPFHAREYNGTQESLMKKTTRNPCLCKADVLERSTQNNMSSVSWTPCSAITYPQPTLVHTCPCNPGVLNPCQHWAPTKYLPQRVRFRRSQIHTGISAKKKNKTNMQNSASDSDVHRRLKNHQVKPHRPHFSI